MPAKSLTPSQVADAYTCWTRERIDQTALAARFGVSRVTMNKALRQHRLDIGEMSATRDLRRRNSTFVPCTDPGVEQTVYFELPCGRVMATSPESYALLKPHRWSVARGKYPATTIDGKTVYAHRLLMPGVEAVDHRDGCPLNARLSNLRASNKQLNMANTPPRNGRFKGVLKTPSGRYRASIMVDRKGIHLGMFDTAELAALAYNRAALEAFGEHAWLNAVETATVCGEVVPASSLPY